MLTRGNGRARRSGQPRSSDTAPGSASKGAAGRLAGGEELAYPPRTRTIRRRGMTDGPFAETKELLGGFIVLDVPDEATAVALA
jgi:hypothetical protein